MSDALRRLLADELGLNPDEGAVSKEDAQRVAKALADLKNALDRATLKAADRNSAPDTLTLLEAVRHIVSYSLGGGMTVDEAAGINEAAKKGRLEEHLEAEAGPGSSTAQPETEKLQQRIAKLEAANRKLERRQASRPDTELIGTTIGVITDLRKAVKPALEAQPGLADDLPDNPSLDRLLDELGKLGQPQQESETATPPHPHRNRQRTPPRST